MAPCEGLAMRYCVLPLLLLALAADKQDNKPDIPALIKQLGSDTFAEREAASTALEKAGPKALDELRKAMKSGDFEVRRRAERIVDIIEKALFREVRKFEGHSGSVNGVAFSPDGKFAASADHRALRIWDLTTGKERAKTEEHDDRVMAVCFSPDGKRIASASEDRTVRIWDPVKLTQERLFKGHKWDVRAVAFSRDGKHLVSGGRDQTVRLWAVATGKAEQVIATGQPIVALALSPDGKQVLAGTLGGDSVLRWDAQTGKPAAGLEGHNGRVMSVCISRDGKRGLTASQDGTLRLWDLTTLQTLLVLKGHASSVSCAAMSADGKRAVSGGIDKKLRIWDLTDGTLIRELTGHTDTIWSVAITPDGKRALTGSHDGTMRLWSVGY
jgi:WD40 repeat protein